MLNNIVLNDLCALIEKPYTHHIIDDALCFSFFLSVSIHISKNRKVEVSFLFQSNRQFEY